MNTAGVIVLVLVLFLVGGAVGWVIFTRWRAQRLGLPPPSWSSFIPFVHSEPSYGVQPARGGVVGWFNDQIRKFRNRNNRSATGAYEGASGGSHVGTGRQGRAGFGPLDPDDAWDARVGAEADMYGPSSYYEEQELGSHPQHGGSSYAMNLATDEESGHSRGRTGGGRANPFEDDAEPSNMSLRGVSPRPIDTSATPAKKSGPKDSGSAESSPTERRSVFRENV